MTTRIFAGLSLIAILIAAGCTREGPMGPPGTAGLGTVEGVVTVWEDIAWNSKNSSVDPAGVTVQLEGTEFSATTDNFGAYKIEAIPAGVYTIMAFKDSASAEGFGTVKQYNFFVGGGTSHFSPDLARKAKPPKDVRAGITVFEEIMYVLVLWTPADAGLTYRYTVWQASDTTFANKTKVGSREGGDRLFVPSYTLLPEAREGDTVYFAVTADNDISYLDKSAGEIVFPTRSELSLPSNSVIVPATYSTFVEGIVTVWDDLYTRSSDPSGVTVALIAWGDTLAQEETDEYGHYLIRDVSVGIYSIVVSKKGYGTVRQDNFSVAGGVSYFSPDIARKADAPVNVQADSTTLEGQSGVRVSWDAPDSGRHHYFVWCTSDTSSGEATYLGNTSGSSVFISYEALPEDARYFGVAADNDISYRDERTGQFVFPSRSETKWVDSVDIPG
ncbi:MAG: hypothetical protein J7M27_13765 [Candidatus Latescibacteria bacterium]|nr:hypothetical protein [Candidatus Latescibacterota bacterium]